MKSYIIRCLGLSLIAIMSGCATLTEDAMTPIALSFSDGSPGKVTLQNKRGAWQDKLPSTVTVRKSDDGLKYNAETVDGRTAVGIIPSEMGAKIVASAVFLDFGITDAITDKHRRYPASYVIPVDAKPEGSEAKPASPASAETKLLELEKMYKAGLISEEEYAAKRKQIIDAM